MDFFYLNKDLHENSQNPVFTIHNRSFKYGDGFFESIRILNGKVLFWDKHYERLLSSLNILQLNIGNASLSLIEEQLHTLILKNNITDGGRARITFYREGEGMYAPQINNANYIIEAYPLENNLFELNKKGLLLDIYSDFKKPLNKLSNIKTNNCLTYVLASVHKNNKQLDDCILLNDNGNIAEATSSNLFIVVNGTLYTPPLSEGCLNGVMRKVLLENAKANGINVYEKELKPSDLLGADELFITSTVRGINWVGFYKNRRYFNNVSKKLIDVLNSMATTN